jgi:DNA gyrase subunit A
MRLRALTGLEREKIEGEYQELMAKIAELKAILADEKKLLGVIREEILAVSAKYGDDRRTVIGYDAYDISTEDLIPETNTVITMTSLGYIKRMNSENFHAQHRGGRGIKGMETIEQDYIKELFMTTSHHYLLFLTNLGRMYRLKAYEIPEASRTSRGTAIINLLQLQPEEKISAVIPVSEFDESKYLLMATRNGIIKKTSIAEYANIRKTGIIAINLRDDDELIDVSIADNTEDAFLVTKKGQCIRFHTKHVRHTGRSSMGVKGISLNEGDSVIGMQLDTQGRCLLFASANGLGKRTEMEEFTPQNRGGKGIRCYKITDKTGDLIGVKAVNDEDEIMMITTEGIIIRMEVSDISVIGRSTSGVKLVNMEDGITVASVAKVKEEDLMDQEESSAADSDGGESEAVPEVSEPSEDE